MLNESFHAKCSDRHFIAPDTHCVSLRFLRGVPSAPVPAVRTVLCIRLCPTAYHRTKAAEATTRSTFTPWRAWMSVVREPKCCPTSRFVSSKECTVPRSGVVDVPALRRCSGQIVVSRLRKPTISYRLQTPCGMTSRYQVVIVAYRQALFFRRSLPYLYLPRYPSLDTYIQCVFATLTCCPKHSA